MRFHRNLLIGNVMALVASPLLAFAAVQQPSNFKELAEIVAQLALLTVPMAALLLYFFWNLSQILFNVNNAEKIKDARTRLVWSIFALFIVFSLTGLIALLQGSLFGESTSNVRTGTPAPAQPLR